MADTNTELIEVDNPPTVYSVQILAKLEEAFHSDYNISAACRYAGISRTTYYDWIKDIPGFADKMEDAQNKLLQKAGEVIAKTINEGDAGVAIKYATLRDPRYKTKVEATVTPEDIKKEDAYAGFLDAGTDDIHDDSQPTDAGGDQEV